MTALLIALMLSTRQASADDGSKFNKFCKKMSELWNFMTIFGTTMKKRIQISTNMPGIGSLIREIPVNISEM